MTLGRSTDSLPADIQKAVDFLTTRTSPCPNAQALVAALVAEEKATRGNRRQYAFADLLGTWRLGFITGTHNSRQATGGLLGAGRFIPRWINIEITYAPASSDVLETDVPETESDVLETEEFPRGSVHNTVKLGLLDLTVSGPLRFFPQRNILAFDFPHLHLSFMARTLYDGDVGGKQSQVPDFFTQPLKQQAFFTYFLVAQSCIAARGRGGGLALWVRQPTSA